MSITDLLRRIMDIDNSLPSDRQIDIAWETEAPEAG